MKFQSMIIASLLTGLFIFCIVMFSIQFSVSNNTNTSLMSFGPINSSFNEINSSLSSSKSTATNETQSFQNEAATTPLTTLGFFFRSILNALGTFINVVVGLFGSMFILAEKTLGIPSIVFDIIMAIILIMITLGAWRLARAGE